MPDYAIADDGARIAFAERGTGVPVLLIAGQATGMHGWGPFADALARDFRVIVFDHRGIGDSDGGDAARYTTRAFANDAVAVLDAAGVAAAHVVGHSMGGRVAQWLAADDPERVRRLVLIATTASDRGGERRDPAVVADLLSGDRARMTPLFFDAAWAEAHPAAVDGFFTRVAGREALRGHFAASRDHDAREALARIRARTLVLHGEHDALTPLPQAQLLADGIPDARLQAFDAGHGLQLDTPAVLEAVRAFLLPPGQRRAHPA
ncbi:alpha/beta hydrolase [Leifsonia sp. LS1]|uniref:alpha/beta fold hydrolase n=1 Tax=Leifsonia sp. LS1 TaxID=2828483 RepID=UPI001CFC5DA0|nr:alpha/beta fold hydrolase [Leifsonia sp. LS1]GIT81215.1 alpha/beta hydrolase [Leifsonia sp. LS1]